MRSPSNRNPVTGRSIEAIAAARSLILRSGWNTMSYQILNPGISLWFSASCAAVIGYVESSTHFIVAGSPIAEEHHLGQTLNEFLHFAQAKRKLVCFFGAQERIALELSNHAPISHIQLGAQPVWRPDNWLSHFYNKPSLRAQEARARNKGVSVSVATGIDLTAHLPALKQCLAEWVSGLRLPPMHFLIEPNTLENLGDRVVIVAKQSDKVVGFCIATPIPRRNGWLIEQTIRSAEAPNGTAELMLHAAIRHLHTINAEMVTLGLSPLSMHYEPQFRQPLWLQTVLRFTRLYGRSFYNFEGLDGFKAKFAPDFWEPVYAITNERNPTPKTLYAIASAFCGYSPIRFVLQGIWRKIL